MHVGAGYDCHNLDKVATSKCRSVGLQLQGFVIVIPCMRDSMAVTYTTIYSPLVSTFTASADDADCLAKAGRAIL